MFVEDEKSHPAISVRTEIEEQKELKSLHIFLVRFCPVNKKLQSKSKDDDDDDDEVKHAYNTYERQTEREREREREREKERQRERRNLA